MTMSWCCLPAIVVLQFLAAEGVRQKVDVSSEIVPPKLPPVQVPFPVSKGLPVQVPFPISKLPTPPLVQSRPKSGQCGIYVGDAGKTFGGESHSVVMALDFSDSTQDADKRQWILNIGQQGKGAEHWLYTPKTGAIQFGTWGPFEGGGQIRDVDISKSKHTLATVYDEQSRTYSLYIDGVLAKSHSNMIFDIKNSVLAAGDKQGYRRNADFNGCIYGVDIYPFALSPLLVQAASLKLSVESAMLPPVKDGLVVSGAGYADANGEYSLNGEHNGKKKWTNDQGCNIVYFPFHWGWGIGCHGHHRYYSPECDGEDPTACKDLLVRTSPEQWAGTFPAPSIAHA